MKWSKFKDGALGLTERSGRNTKLLCSCGIFESDHICTDYQISITDICSCLVDVLFLLSYNKAWFSFICHILCNGTRILCIELYVLL